MSNTLPPSPLFPSTNFVYFSKDSVPKSGLSYGVALYFACVWEFKILNKREHEFDEKEDLN